MERHLYAYNAGPLEFCQYPYSPKRGLPFGTEPAAVTVFESGRLRLYTFCQNADSIAVSIDAENRSSRKFQMESDGSGNFGIDIFDLPPGRYRMHWYYDGKEKINRHAPVCLESGILCNFVEIPGPTPGEFEFRNVPHGTLRQEYIKSEVLGGFVNSWVYTPPGYDFKGAERYPVLYLLSGSEGNEMTWFGNGKLDMLLDNLLSEGRCRRMLAVSVCTSGVSGKEILEKTDAFLEKDVLPFVEKKFAVKADAIHRAVIGFSDAAEQAEYLAGQHPKRFGWAGLLRGEEAWMLHPSGRKEPLFVKGLWGMQLWRAAACGMVQKLFEEG